LVFKRGGCDLGGYVLGGIMPHLGTKGGGGCDLGGLCPNTGKTEGWGGGRIYREWHRAPSLPARGVNDFSLF